METAYSNGQIIDASHVNELTASLLNQFVGRNTSGVPEPGKSLGTAAIPWGVVYADSMVVDGQAIDTTQITSLANRIVSGPTRALSDQPDFLRADGTVATLDILGASTNIVLSINATAVSISTDIAKTGLTLAPSTNNTALVNDANIVNDLYAGELDAKIPQITIGTVGSEISAKVGQYIGLQTATGEIMYAYLKDATTLTNVFRGFFFDDSGAPIVRGNLSDTDTLTLINLGWVFAEDNGTTIDVSYLQPVYSYEAPSGPTTGQYWFDMSNQVWKRYSGTEFEIINRTIIGLVALDDTAAIATRSADFTRNFRELNNVEVELASSEIVRSNRFENRVSVYGNEIIQDYNKMSWNITTDLESGQVEAASTLYYLYVSTKGQRVMSTHRPFERADLKGYYHPYHSWRCVGIAFNNGSNDLILVDEIKYNSDVRSTTVVYSQVEAGDGGAFTSGSYQVRPLNTIHQSAKFSNLSSNQIGLIQGEYIVLAECPAYNVNIHKARLYNVDDSTVGLLGTNSAIAPTAGATMTNAVIVGVMRVESAKVFELQHRCNTTKTVNGFGLATAFGDDNIYAIIRLIKIR